MIYEPQEDSYLLKESLPKDLNKVLEIGCGSGIISVEAAKRGASVTAVDINKQAVQATKDLAKKEGVSIKGFQSDLFSKIEDKFDLIICNPPYLPNDPKDPDIALDGGKQGWEFIEKLLQQAKDYLTEEGSILLLFSSRTNKEKILELIRQHYVEFLRKQKHVFFEDLYVYELFPKHFLAKGKRGYVYTIKNNIAIKEKNPEADVNTLENEANFLKILNKHNIGPKFIEYRPSQLIREYIEGETIEEYIQHASKKQVKNVLKEILKQCKTLDDLKINKFEMTRPYKHILIGKKVTMIDFERCRYSEKPKNVTQCCQFIARFKELKEKISYDPEKIIELGKQYKQNNYDENIFKKIISLLDSDQ